MALFILTRWRPRLWVALVVIGLLYWFVAGHLLVVPLVNGEPRVPADPLLPCGWAVVAGLLFGHPMRQIEEIAHRRLTWARAWWFALVLAVGGALSIAAGAVFSATAPAESTRSWLAFLGVTLICGQLLGIGLSWFGPVLLLVATLFLGKDDVDNPRAWAWLLHEPSWSSGGQLVSLGILVIGAALYVGGIGSSTSSDGRGEP
ncbi:MULTISPECIES: hypothetical protein [Saccharothrix]|uniref:hypothetical protein n=1 Tax=Saccharothrix TaxID=2071 RepID=UPI00093BEC6F|nr:hypothetical protein [Saccharothrix sp. CB00851]OKI18666.1 hypothetical protein A6A25_39650 [Saccharothrix sp. CB00851]